MRPVMLKPPYRRTMISTTTNSSMSHSPSTNAIHNAISSTSARGPPSFVIIKHRYDYDWLSDSKRGVRNFRGDPVQIPEGHVMSPRDLPLSARPRVKSGPFTTQQRARFLRGKSAGTKLSPHHRHQIPTSHGGVIDELPEPGHPVWECSHCWLTYSAPWGISVPFRGRWTSPASGRDQGPLEGKRRAPD